MKHRLIVNWRIACLAMLVTILVGVLGSRSYSYSKVDIGGYSLRTLIQRNGYPVVVFENGHGLPLESWDIVQNKVSDFATTISYDRASTARSDDGPLPRDAHQVANELHNMLQKSETTPPYILVGASLGGLFARTYASMFPEDVSALILVDPGTDSEIPERDRIDSKDPEVQALHLIRNQASGSIVPKEIPVFLIAAMAFEESPYLAALDDASKRKYSDINVEKMANYKASIESKPNSQLIVTGNSRHLVAHEQPQLIADTVREAIELTLKLQ